MARRATLFIIGLVLISNITAQSPTTELPEDSTEQTAVAILTNTGDRFVGKIIACSGARLVVLTTVGELTLEFPQIARIEFNPDPSPSPDPMVTIGLAGYSIVGDTPCPPFPKDLRVFFAFGADDRARQNAISHFQRLSSRASLRDWKFGITDSPQEANVIVIRLLGSDVRSEVRSGTYTQTYLDIFQGGLRQAPATSVYTVSTVDISSAILYVDHEAKKLFVAHYDVSRGLAGSGRKSGRLVIEKMFEFIR